jgi:hypothetical protein
MPNMSTAILRRVPNFFATRHRELHDSSTTYVSRG